MVPSRGTCTLLASHRGRGSGARGAGSFRAEGCRRGRTGCVCVNLPQVRCHTDPLGEPGTRPRSAGPCSTTPGCCHPPRPRASPATPVHSGILAFLSVAAVWTWAGKRPRPTPPPCPSSPNAEPARESQTAGQRPRLPRRHFLRSSQVPAPSASSACGLPLYFSPNRLPGGHGMRGCSGIGREFRIWRRPCWSLWAWSAWLL